MAHSIEARGEYAFAIGWQEHNQNREIIFPIPQISPGKGLLDISLQDAKRSRMSAFHLAGGLPVLQHG